MNTEEHRTPVVWRPQPRQAECMRRPEPEALYGGAAGGGLAGLLFRKMSAKALHLILGAVILAGGIRLIVC